MPARHLDRLTAVDASFLHQEGPVSHMHIGALVRVAGPAPRYDDFLNSIRGRLHLVPRYRQRLLYPPPRPARPPWGAPPPPRPRPAVGGRRPRLQPRLPRAPHRAAEPGQRRAALQPLVTRLLPAA